MNFTGAKQIADALHAASKVTGAALAVFPRSAMGLTPDAVRVTREYQTAKAAFDAAFAKERSFNAYFTKVFKKELAAQRAARFAEVA